MKTRSDKRPKLIKVKWRKQEQRRVACNLQVGEEVFKDIREVEFSLTFGKRFKQGLLKELKHRLVGKEITQHEADKENDQTSHESGFQFFQMLPKAHDGAAGAAFMRLILNLIHDTLLPSYERK